ncbi:MAG: hypothetical protein JSR59_10395 [Proteobacteria bacterium]|nr:hypothetical protein [Pseudomonadota bacterium]
MRTLLLARPHRRVLESLYAVLALLVLVAGSSAWAQDVAAGDPPGRVARVSDLNGQIWIYTPDAGEWVAGTVNQPLTTGDRIATDASARAEVRVGSTALRLDASSELEVVQLDDSQVALQLHSGSLAARVRSAEAARELGVTTPEGHFRFDQPGRYRIDIAANNASDLTVYSGQATYERDRVALPVTPGQHAQFWIDAQQVAQYALSAPVQDDFAAWANERDASDDRYAAPSYVSPEMTGVEDLGRYGTWEQTADDGPVWTPTTVAAGWTPYSTGYWSFVRPWGWTWIDASPWGFAPFHYGRWLWARNRWCWAPGRYVARPVYAPALVAWVGGGVSVGIGGPAVGWFPLGPRDVYVPSYRYSQRYVHAVNVANVTNVTEINRVVNLPAERREFVNRRYANAVTVVPASVVTGRQPVAAAAAQARGMPWARELATQPARVAALTAPPVATPAAPQRRIDPRTIRPPMAGGGARPLIGREPAEVRQPAGEGGRPAGTPPATAAAPAPIAQRPAPQAVTPAPVAPRPAPQAVTPAPVAPRPAPRAAAPAEPEVRQPLPGARNDPRVPGYRPDAPAAPRMQRAPTVEERAPLPAATNNPRVTRPPAVRPDDEPRTLPAPAQQRPPQRAEPQFTPPPQRAPAEAPRAPAPVMRAPAPEARPAPPPQQPQRAPAPAPERRNDRAPQADR